MRLSREAQQYCQNVFQVDPSGSLQFTPDTIPEDDHMPPLFHATCLGALSDGPNIPNIRPVTIEGGVNDNTYLGNMHTGIGGLKAAIDKFSSENIESLRQLNGETILIGGCITLAAFLETIELLQNIGINSGRLIITDISQVPLELINTATQIDPDLLGNFSLETHQLDITNEQEVEQFRNNSLNGKGANLVIADILSLYTLAQASHQKYHRSLRYLTRGEGFLLERHYRTIPKQASLFAFLGICDPKDITKAEALYEKYITSMDSDLPGQSLRLQIALLQAIQTIPGFKNFQVPTKEELELFWRKVFADIPIFKTPRIEELIKDSMFPNFSPKDWVTFVIGNFDRIVALDSILWQKTKRT